MNVRILVLTIILALAGASARAQVTGSSPAKYISVSGTAEVKVTPDLVELSVGVETCDASLKNARKRNDEAIAGALKFLRLSGIADKYIQTDFISIEPVNENRRDFSGDPSNPDHYNNIAKPTYYRVLKRIGITITNIADFDAILSGVLDKGVNVVQGIEFKTTELRKYKDKAREMAIQAAREKATAMTDALDVQLGKPVNININDWSGWGGTHSSNYGGASYLANVIADTGGEGGTTRTFAVGQINVSATVNLTYALQ
jgi:hypothetical protein